MGRASNRRRQFLAEHPLCCFCGGREHATTQDHVPSRAFFNGRVSPEGFSFPACARCNAATANDEQLAAMVCRIGNLDATDGEAQQNVRLMKGVDNNYPGLLSRMVLGSVAKRRWLREQGASLEQGQSTADFGLFDVSDDRVQDAVAQFARKLLLALFYRHTNAIFPTTGSFAYRWFSNSNLDEIHPVVAQIAPGLTLPDRANTSLGDQFFYRYGVAGTGRATAFLAVFHESAAILGVMFGYDVTLEAPPVGRVLRSFAWE